MLLKYLHEIILSYLTCPQYLHEMIPPCVTYLLYFHEIIILYLHFHSIYMKMSFHIYMVMVSTWTPLIFFSRSQYVHWNYPFLFKPSPYLHEIILWYFTLHGIYMKILFYIWCSQHLHEILLSYFTLNVFTWS